MKEISTASRNLLDIYLGAIEIMVHGAMILDKDGNILGVNNSFASQLGYNKSDFERKSIFQVNPTTTLITWKKTWSELLSSNAIILDTQQMTSTGAIFPVKMRGILLDIEGEKFCLCLVVNLMDANRYLDLLNMASKISRFAAWEWDLVSEKFYFSDSLFSLLGHTDVIEINKSNIRSFLESNLGANEAGLLLKQAKESMKTGESVERELLVYRAKDDFSAQFELLFKPVILEGKAIKIYGALHDVSGFSARTEEMYLTKFCMDNAREMIFWTEQDGRIIYANESSCNTLEYSLKKLKQKRAYEISKDFDLDKWNAHWQELSKAKNLVFEAVHVSKSGKDIPVRISANYIEYKGKAYNCSFVNNLSKKKKSEALIELTHFTMNQSSEMVTWARPDGTFLFYNDAFCSNLGYTRDELEKIEPINLVPGFTQEDLINSWDHLREYKSLEGDYNLLRKDGSLLVAEIKANYVVFKGKELVVSVIRDVTEQKIKEHALSEAVDKIGKLKGQLESDNLLLKEEIELKYSFNNIISVSKNYKKVLKQVEQVADTDATVLILGETGTGKELLARAIHQLSDRSDRPLVKINCAALPENLIESEFFGHEKGSFTGAFRQKTGRFEMAHKGTIFLDEVGELPLELQSKLLRVLQEGEFERVGGNDTIKVDVRVVAATNRVLDELVEEGLFREDLYYRLNVFPIFNIPLRERREDIPLLVKHFAEKLSARIGKKITEIPRNLLDELFNYNFPGNVRELENIIERAVILTQGKSLQIDVKSLFSRSSQGKISKFKSLDEMQKDHIIEALRQTQGKVSGDKGAAHLLQINDKTLTSRMKKLGIQKTDYLK